MSALDPRTANRGYPKSDPLHIGSEDASRIAQALDMVDGDVKAVLDAIEEAEILALALGS